MLQELMSEGELYQEAAAEKLLGYGDDEIAYYDDNGYARIGKKVLAAFNKISSDVVYSRGEKYWRPREDDDEPGRRQA
jgi:hypothetical protein